MDISDLLKPNMEYPKNKKEIPMEQKHIWYVQGITCHNQRYPWYILRHWYIVWNCPLLYAQTQKLIIWVRIPGGYCFFLPVSVQDVLEDEVTTTCTHVQHKQTVAGMTNKNFIPFEKQDSPDPQHSYVVWNVCRHNNVMQNPFQAESKPFKTNCRPPYGNVKGWQF